MNEHTLALLSALAGVDTVYDFRAIHDRDAAATAIPLRGTIAQCEPELRRLNGLGYGIHVMVNETDGMGRLRSNVTAIRAQLCDLDRETAGQMLGRIAAAGCAPHAIVHTSPGKVQVWWMVEPHHDAQLYSDTQRRLAAAYDGDTQVIDVAHTARLPGFYHCKGEPSFVTVAAGGAWGAGRWSAWDVAAPVMHVVVSSGAGERRELGWSAWAAPDSEWLVRALWRIDPNALDRADWIAVTAAFKQAGWQWGEAWLRATWDAWCAWYRANNPRENHKQWTDIRETSAGWSALVKRSGIGGEIMAAGLTAHGARSAAATDNGDTVARTSAADAQAVMDAQNKRLSSYLSPLEQSQYFAGCFFVTGPGKIIGPNGRMMDQNRFNANYGGKVFLLSDQDDAQKTDEAWRAATRGLSWTVPKVDHLRFMPQLPFGEVLTDEFGQRGVNTYRVPVVLREPGDVGPWLEHCERLFPDAGDRALLWAFMAQCVQRPGVKVKWGLVIQSMEGAGKQIFQMIMEAALGRRYVYSPKSRELTEGGGKFNGWMRDKLMILINEIKTDEKRDLIEVMKTWITEDRCEMESKGVDADMYDNPTNFLMFTNYQDAVPINRNSRRYAILYSAIQDESDLLARGMTGEYFTRLYNWTRDGGAAHVVDWLMRYDVPHALDGQGAATRAPKTTSTDAAINASLGWLERVVTDAVEDGRAGFRGGWVSTVAVHNLLRELGYRMPGPNVIPTALKGMGYYLVGKSTRIWPQELANYQSRLYHKNKEADVHNYGLDQGYAL